MKRCGALRLTRHTLIRLSQSSPTCVFAGSAAAARKRAATTTIARGPKRGGVAPEPVLQEVLALLDACIY